MRDTFLCVAAFLGTAAGAAGFMFGVDHRFVRQQEAASPTPGAAVHPDVIFRRTVEQNEEFRRELWTARCDLATALGSAGKERERADAAEARLALVLAAGEDARRREAVRVPRLGDDPADLILPPVVPVPVPGRVGVAPASGGPEQ